MTAKNERMLAFILAGLMLVVGVVCYAAFPHEAPEEPLRFLFPTTAGKVFFFHKTHAAEDGYGIACSDCHHEEQEGTMSCSGEDCHGAESDVKRGDAFHRNCKGCHEEGGAGPVECSGCHVL